MYRVIKNFIKEIYFKILFKINKRFFYNNFINFQTSLITEKINSINIDYVKKFKENHIEFIKILLLKNKYHLALNFYFSNKKAIDENNIDNLFVILQLLIKTNENLLAANISKKILNLDPNNKDIFNIIYAPFKRNNMKNELREIFSLTRHQNLLWPYGNNYHFIKQQDKAIFNKKKFIFINALPKSGSTFVAMTLSKNYNFPKTNIGLSYFPDEIIIPNYLALALRGGCLCMQHINKSKDNYKILKDFGIRKFLIQIRDPRQVILSWTCMLDEFFHNNKINSLMSLSSPFLPPNYFSFNFEKKLNWQINNYFKLFENWILDWINVKFMHIEFLSFQQLRNNPSNFFNKISSFYEIELPKKIKYPPKNKNVNYRKGHDNEWESFDELRKININIKLEKLLNEIV